MKPIEMPRNVLAVLAMQTTTSNWPEPETLIAQLAPVQTLTQCMLPPVIWDYVKDEAERMQAPPDFVAAATLSALGSIIGTTAAIRPKQLDSWAVHPILWGAILGLPGSKKSASIAAGTRSIYRLEKDAEAAYGKAKGQAKLQEMQDKSQIKSLQRQLKQTDAAEKAAATQGTAPPSPSSAQIEAAIAQLEGQSYDVAPPPRLCSNDATVEALGILLADNPRGLLVSHDELMSFLMGLEKPGREGERPFYLSAWNGDSPARVDRVSRPSLYIPRLCLTLFGGIQPSLFQSYMAQSASGLNNDGLIQRLQLMVYPDPLVPTAIVDRSPDHKARAALSGVFDYLYADKHIASATLGQGEEAPYFQFEPHQAQPDMLAWLLKHQLDVSGLGEDMFAQHLNKYTKLVPSLALIFHLVGMANGSIQPSSLIGVDELSMAIQFTEYLESHARRVYGMAATARYRAPHALAAKIKSGELKGLVTARGIQRKCWSNLSDKSDIDAATKELEAAGWLRAAPSGKAAGAPGRPSQPRFEINPRILEATVASTPLTKPTKPRRKRK